MEANTDKKLSDTPAWVEDLIRVCKTHGITISGEVSTPATRGKANVAIDLWCTEKGAVTEHIAMNVQQNMFTGVGDFVVHGNEARERLVAMSKTPELYPSMRKRVRLAVGAHVCAGGVAVDQPEWLSRMSRAVLVKVEADSEASKLGGTAKDLAEKIGKFACNARGIPDCVWEAVEGIPAPDRG